MTASHFKHSGEFTPRGSLLQLCLTLCNPMDCSPPGSFVHGIFQARVLEWGASAFSVSRHSDHLKCKSALIIPPQNIPVLLQLSQNN